MITMIRKILVLSLLLSALATAQYRVLTGIDVLQKQNFEMLRGKKIGLITNQTGINREGVRTIDLLAKAPGVALAAIFSPEHGLSGTEDRSSIGDTVDPATGIRVYSLYGATRRPTPEMLEDLDVLVYDIQDVGVRYYTYITTMAYAMEAAEKEGKKFIVLDRPAMLRGDRIEGYTIRKELISFTGCAEISTRYGMTPGELAMFMNDRMNIGADLDVVKMEGWNRTLWFDETGLPWRNPSPNIRSMTEALLYSGPGALEATNLSVGRGTDTPFEIFGTPTLDAQKIARELNMTFYLGAKFEPVDFTPAAEPFRGIQCHGVKITITNRDALPTSELMVALARALLRQEKDLNLQNRRTAELVGATSFAEKMIAGECTCEINGGMRSEVARFKMERTKYLLYQ